MLKGMVNMQNKINETIKTNSKRVWIGDPCYVLQDELWDDVCKQIFKDGKEVGHVITVNYKGNNLSYINCGTAYGDGCFNSKSGFEYGVDSGALAIVPEELIHEDFDLDSSLGCIFEIKTDSISLQTDGKGTFIFSDGSKVIETIWTGDEEEKNIAKTMFQQFEENRKETANFISALPTSKLAKNQIGEHIKALLVSAYATGFAHRIPDTEMTTEKWSEVVNESEFIRSMITDIQFDFHALGGVK